MGFESQNIFNETTLPSEQSMDRLKTGGGVKHCTVFYRRNAVLLKMGFNKLKNIIIAAPAINSTTMGMLLLLTASH